MIISLNQSHTEIINDILSKSNLPTADIDLNNQLFIGYSEDEQLKGIGALEVYDNCALLRSLAVIDNGKKRGIGSKLVSALIDKAKTENIEQLFLLTETASAFFLKKGFKTIDRVEVPESILASEEFSKLCPTSASCMTLKFIDKMKKNILVLCTGNSCRSQIADGYLKSMLDESEWNVYSAGVETHGVNPKAIATMKRDGIDISNNTSNHIDEYADVKFDHVITVCDNAKERCPYFPTEANKVHHNFPDPAKATGSESEVNAEFDSVREMIKNYLTDFVGKL